jgi:hypothetical protein
MSNPHDDIYYGKEKMGGSGGGGGRKNLYDKLLELDNECQMFVNLMKFQEPGLFTWFDQMTARLTNIKKLINEII